MRHNDQQLGIPERIYEGLRGDIESNFVTPGMIAYASDSGTFGYRNANSWIWVNTGTSGGSFYTGTGNQIVVLGISGDVISSYDPSDANLDLATSDADANPSSTVFIPPGIYSDVHTFATGTVYVGDHVRTTVFSNTLTLPPRTYVSNITAWIQGSGVDPLIAVYMSDGCILDTCIVQSQQSTINAEARAISVKGDGGTIYVNRSSIATITNSGTGYCAFMEVGNASQLKILWCALNGSTAVSNTNTDVYTYGCTYDLAGKSGATLPGDGTSATAYNHNDLSSIQGGVSNQYYHLTSNEYTGVGTGTFVRQGELDNYISVSGDTMIGDLNFLDAGITNVDFINFNLSGTSSDFVGRLRWNNTDRCLEYDSSTTTTVVTNQLGQEIWVRVRNNTASNISNGVPVYVTGAIGNRPTIAPAKADSESTSLTFIGLTTEDINKNEDGFVTILGIVRHLDTNSFTAGQRVYVSATNAGEITNVRPDAPNQVCVIGIVTVKSGGSGEIAVSPRIQPNLERLSNVYITGSSHGDFISYDTGSYRWETRSFAGINSSLDHNSLDNLPDGNVHTQYLTRTDFDDIQRFGFLNQTETSIYFNDSTYYFSLSGTNWSYWRSGLKNTIVDSKTVRIANPPVNNTMYYIYINDDIGSLTAATDGWTLADTKVPVATIYWDATSTPKYVFCEERHTCQIDRNMHRYEHLSEGTKFISGGVIGDYSTVAPPTDAKNTFSLTSTVIADEDIFLTLPVITDMTGTSAIYNLVYQSGTAWHWSKQVMPFVYDASTNYIKYSSNGVLTDVTQNYFCNYYLASCNGINGIDYFLVPGRSQFSNATAAYAESIATFTFPNFITAESVFFYQITYEVKSSYVPAKGNCKIDRIQRITTNVITSSISYPTDHNSLSGLEGGTAGEYYHLTAAQYAALGGGGSGSANIQEAIERSWLGGAL